MLRSRSLFSKFFKIKCSRPATVSYIINHEIVSNRHFLHTSKSICNSSSDWCSPKYKENFNNKLIKSKHKLSSINQLDTTKEFGISINTRNNCSLGNEKSPSSNNTIIRKNGTANREILPREYLSPNKKTTHISRKVNFKHEISNKKLKGTKVVNKNHGVVKSKKVLDLNSNSTKANDSYFLSEETIKSGLKLNNDNKNSTEDSSFQNYIGETQNQLKPNNTRLSKQSKFMEYFEKDESIKKSFVNNNYFQDEQFKNVETENDILNLKSNMKHKNRFNSDHVIYHNKSEYKSLKNNSQQKSHSVDKKSSKTINYTKSNNVVALKKNNSALEKSKVHNNKPSSKLSKLYMEYLQQEANNNNTNQFQECNDFVKEIPNVMNKFETKNTKHDKILKKRLVLIKKSNTKAASIKNRIEIESKSIRTKCSHKKSATISSGDANRSKNVSVFQIHAEARKLYSKFLEDKKCNDNKNLLNIKKTKKACSNMLNEKTNDSGLGLFTKSGATGASVSSMFIPSNLKSPKSYNITKRANSTHNFSYNSSNNKHEKLNNKISNNKDKNKRNRDKLKRSKSVDTGIEKNKQALDVKSNSMKYADKINNRSKSAVSIKTPSLNTSQSPKSFKVNSMDRVHSDRSKSKLLKNNDDNNGHSYNTNRYRQKADIVEQFHNVKHKYEQAGTPIARIKKKSSGNNSVYFQETTKSSNRVNNSVRSDAKKLKNNSKVISENDIEQFSSVKHKFESPGFSSSKIKNISTCSNALITETDKPEDCYVFDTRQIQEHESVPRFNRNKDSEDNSSAENVHLKSKSKHESQQRSKSLTEPQLNHKQIFKAESESNRPNEIANKNDEVNNKNYVEETKVNEPQKMKTANKIASKSGTVDRYNKYKEQFKFLEQTSQNNLKGKLEDDSMYGEVRYEQHSKPQNEPQKCHKFKKYDKLTNEIIAKMGTSPPKPKKKIPVKFTTAVCRTKVSRNPIIPFKDTKLKPQFQANTKVAEDPKQFNKFNSETKEMISNSKEKSSKSKKQHVTSSVNNTEIYKSKPVREKTVLPKSSNKEVDAAINNTKIHKSVSENKREPNTPENRKEMNPIRNKKQDEKTKSVQKPKDFENEEVKEKQVEQIKQNKKLKDEEAGRQTDYSPQHEMELKQLATKDPIINELNSKITSNETIQNLQKFKAIPTTRLDLTNKLLALTKIEQEIDFYNTPKKDVEDCTDTDKISKFDLKSSNEIPRVEEKQEKNIKTSDTELKTDNIEEENNSKEQFVENNIISKNKPSKLPSKRETENTILEFEERNKQNNPPNELKKQQKPEVFKERRNHFENNWNKQIENKQNCKEHKDVEFKTTSSELDQKPLITPHFEAEHNDIPKSKYLNETKYYKKIKSSLTTDANLNASNETQKICSNKLKENSNPVLEGTKLTDLDKNRIKKERDNTRIIGKSGKSKLHQSKKLKKSSVKSNLSRKNTILKSKSFSKSGQDKKHVHHQNISFKNEILNNKSLVDLQQKPTILDKFSNLITNIEPFINNLPKYSLLDPPKSVFKKIKYNRFKNVNSKNYTKFSLLNRSKGKCELNLTNKSKILAKSSTLYGINNSKKVSNITQREAGTNPPSRSPNGTELTNSKKKNLKEFLTDINNNSSSKTAIKNNYNGSLNKKKSDSKLKDPLVINRGFNKRSKSVKFAMSLKGKKHYRLLTTSPLKRNNFKNNGTRKRTNFHKTGRKYIQTGLRNNKKSCGFQTTCLDENKKYLTLGEDNFVSKNSINSLLKKNKSNDFLITTKSENILNNEISEGNNCTKTEMDPSTNESTRSKINTSNIIVTTPFEVNQESKVNDDLPKESDFTKLTFSNSSCENQSLTRNKNNSANEIIATDVPFSFKVAKSSKSIQKSFSGEENNEKEISVYKDKNKFKHSTSESKKDNNSIRSVLPDLKNEFSTPTVSNNYEVLKNGSDMDKYDDRTLNFIKPEKKCDTSLKSKNETRPEGQRVSKLKKDHNLNINKVLTSRKNKNQSAVKSDTKSISSASNDKNHSIKDLVVSRSEMDNDIKVSEPPNKNESIVNSKEKDTNLVNSRHFNSNIKLESKNIFDSKDIKPTEIRMSLFTNSENKVDNELMISSKSREQIEFEVYEKIKDSETNITFKDVTQDLGKPLLKSDSNIRNESPKDKPKFEFKDKTVSESESRNNSNLAMESSKDKTKRNISTTPIANDFINLNFNTSDKSFGKNRVLKLENSEMKNRNEILFKDRNIESIPSNKTESKDNIYDPKAKYEKTFFLPSNIKIIYSPNEHIEDQPKINNDKQSVSNNKISQNTNSSSVDSSNNSVTTHNFLKKSLYNHSKNTENNRSLSLSSKNDDGNWQHQVENKKNPLRPTSSYNEKRIESKLSSLKIEQNEYDSIMNFLKTETTDKSLFGSKLSKKPQIVTGAHSYNEEAKINKKQSIKLKKNSSETKVSEKIDTASRSVNIKALCYKVNNETNNNNEQERKPNVISKTEMQSLKLNNENIDGISMTDEKQTKKSVWLASIFPNHDTITYRKQELSTHFQSNSVSKSGEKNIENASQIKEHESYINCDKNKNSRKETELNLENINASSTVLLEKENLQDNTSKYEIKNSFWIKSVLPKYQQETSRKQNTKSDSVELDSNLKTNPLRVQKESFNGSLAKNEFLKLNKCSMLRPNENIQNFIPDKKRVRSYVKYDNILKRVKSESLLKCDAQSYYKTIDKHLTISKSQMSSKEFTESDSGTNKTSDSSNYLKNDNKEKKTEKSTTSKNISWVTSVIPNLHQNQISEIESKDIELRKFEVNNSMNSKQCMTESREKGSLNSNSKCEKLLDDKFKKLSIIKENENMKNSNKFGNKKTFWMGTILPSCHEIEDKLGVNNYNNTGSNSCTKNNGNKIQTKAIKTLFPQTTSYKPSAGQNKSTAQQKSYSESSTGSFQKDKSNTRDVVMINEIKKNPLWVETVVSNHKNESKIKEKSLEDKETENVINFSNDPKITEHTIFNKCEHNSTLKDNKNSDKKCHEASSSFQTGKQTNDYLCNFSDLTITKSKTIPEIKQSMFNSKKISEINDNASNNTKQYIKSEQSNKAPLNIELSESSKMNEEERNKLHLIQCLLQKCNENQSKCMKTDQTNDSKLLKNSSNEDYANQRDNRGITVVKTKDIMDGSDCIGTKLSTETIYIDQCANKPKHNIVVFEREIQNSSLFKAIHSLNDTSNRNVREENKENQSHRAVLNKVPLSNKAEITPQVTKQRVYNLENKLTTDKSNIDNYAGYIENGKLNKINFSDYQKLPTTGGQIKSLNNEESLGRIDIKLKNVKNNKENITNIESAFLIIQGQVPLPQASDLQSKITNSANESQIDGEIEISCKREKNSDKNVYNNQLMLLQYKHDITSFLKDSSSIYSKKKQTNLIKHLKRAKSLINNCVVKHEHVNAIKNNKSENMGLNIKSEKDSNTMECNKKNKEDQNSKLTSLSFQFMKYKKYDLHENSTATVKLSPNELNNIIDDVKKPVNVTINDYQEKEKTLNYTSKNSKKISKNEELLHENVKMSKATTVTEDDKRTKNFKNKDNVLSSKIPLIIIDGKKTLNFKCPLTKAVESISVNDPKGKFAYPIENYPLENKKRSKTYYPLVIVNIKSLKLSDLPPEAQKFHSVYDILSYTSDHTSLDYIDKKKEIIKDLQELNPQKDLTLQEIVFKKRLHRFLMVKNLKSKDDVFLNSLNWTWPYFTSISAVKSYTMHPGLFYKGVITCVAKFKDHPVIVEWKLLKNPTVSPVIPKDAAIKLAALMGALNYDNNFNFQVTKGIVILAYLSGDPADMFILSSQNCQVYWKTWLSLLKNYLVTHNNKIDKKLN